MPYDAPVDPEPWNLLHDGRLIALARVGPTARVTIESRHHARAFGGEAFDLVLAGVHRLAYRPYTDRADEPWIEDPAAIVALAPSLVEAKLAPLEDGEGMVVWCPLGELSLAYDALTIEVNEKNVALEALRETVAAFWADWRSRQA